jgi:hypothetical protein
MKIRKSLFNLIVLAILLLITGCQKEDLIEPNQKVSICPEIAMKNYEEAGLMINEFLKNQHPDGRTNISDQLISYLEKCDCVDTIKMTSTLIYTYPAIQEYYIRFIINKDTIENCMDFFLYNNDKIEFHKFHD